MKKLINSLNVSLLRAKFAVEDFMNEERGDTNFISIAIILVIVIAIAILFMTLGKDMATKLEQAIKDLMGAF